MKKFLYLIIIILVVLVLALVLVSRKAEAPSAPLESVSSNSTSTSSAFLPNPRNMSFLVDGEEVVLKDGKSVEKVSAARATEIVTEVVGEPVFGDIGAGDGSSIMYLVQQGGGTGVFVYVVATYNVNGVHKGTEAFFLGDRVVPKDIKIVDGVAEVNYLGRKSGAAMSDEPTVPMKKRLVIGGGELREE